MKEIHIFVSGLVQGVGFRASVKRHAQLHGIKGYVRNLSDGRVEICAQGTEEQIHSFLESIQTKPGLGKVSSLDTKYRPLQETYSNFDLR